MSRTSLFDCIKIKSKNGNGNVWQRAVAVNRVSARTNVICIELSTISLMSVCVYVRFWGLEGDCFLSLWFDVE